MTEFAQALGAIVAFLLPVGMYCLLLASINRRPRPVIVSGSWDSVGLLFAASGFLVVTIPILLTEFYRRSANEIANDRIITLWLGHWILWLVYYSLLVTGGGLMIRWRGQKTMIYNVDLELFPKALEQAAALVGLEAKRGSSRLTLVPANAIPAELGTAFTQALPAVVAIEKSRHAELEIESFPSMCHATLHWSRYSPGVREEIERELEKSLESAAPLENPVAGWFLSISGLILGAVAAVVLAMVMLVFLTPR